MTKPDDIPQEVWNSGKPDDVSQEAWDAAAVGVDYRDKRQVLIARAIMAAKAEELADCIAVVDPLIKTAGVDDWAKGYRCAAAEIASVLRKRGEEA
jgi:hypothetical protein